jgi:hypothetical protein
MTEHGVYDEAGDVDPALLHRYYGSQESNNSNSHSNSCSPSGSSPSSMHSTNSSNSLGFDGDTLDSDSSSSPGSNGSPDTGSSGSSDSATESDGDEDSEEEEEEDTYQDIAKTIASSQKRNIRHDAAKVAGSAIPFEGADELHAYTLAVGDALASNEYPAGFNLSEEYDLVESYKTGRSSRPLIIPLPYDVWFPRIVVWCKALDLLKRLPMCRAAAVSSV